MFWAGKIFAVAGALLALQSAWALIDGFRFLRLVRNRFQSPRAAELPSAAVLIPCKGVDAGFEANLNAFLQQDHPDYRVIFIVSDEDDPVYQKLKAHVDLLSSRNASKPRAALVVAGIAEGRGEKVNNLLRGLDAADSGTQIFVFADMDATPHKDWLASLVSRLSDPQVTVSTGFRWYLPGRGFVSQLRAAWDTSIATMLGDHGVKFAWGGSMAIRAQDFRRLKIAESYWANTVSDDYAMTRAVNDAEERIAFEPRCLLASQEESTLSEFLRWSTRQIIITRVYASHLWKLGLVASIFYCGTFLLGIALLICPAASSQQSLMVAETLLVILLLGAGKGYIRTVVAREMFEIGAGASCYWLLSPLVPWVMLGNFVVAGLTRRIEWRGTEYELVSRTQVRVIRRSSTRRRDT